MKRDGTTGRLVSTHGMSRSPEYVAWAQMLQRCENESSHAYADYGGRGIRVTPEWQDFETFYKDVGPRPSPRHSIDRKDNSKGYCPSNCRWATKQEQVRNRRGVVLSEAGAAWIRAQVAAGATQASVAFAARLSQQQVSRVVKGQRWR